MSDSGYYKWPKYCPLPSKWISVLVWVGIPFKQEEALIWTNETHSGAVIEVKNKHFSYLLNKFLLIK